jgi:hypothetical protein
MGSFHWAIDTSNGHSYSMLYVGVGTDVVCVPLEAPQGNEAKEAIASNSFERVEQFVAKYMLQKVSKPDSVVEFDKDQQVVVNGRVYCTSLTRHIQNVHKLGFPIANLLEFMRCALNNPIYDLPDKLFDFIQRNKLTVTEDGSFIGYIGGGQPGYHPAGQKIELPKKVWETYPTHGYLQFFEVGGLSNASSQGFKPTRLMVKVNPRDVMTLPDRSEKDTLFCCLYEIVGAMQAPDIRGVRVEPRKDPSATAQAATKVIVQ